MKMLWGKEYRLWQMLRAEYARVTAELEGEQRISKTFAETIQQLREEIQYHRERADRAVDDLLLTRGVLPIRPEPRMPEEDPFIEDPVAVEALEKRMAADPNAVWGTLEWPAN